MTAFALAVTFVVVMLNSTLAIIALDLLPGRRSGPRWLAIAVVVWLGAMVMMALVQEAAPDAWRPFLHHWFYFPIAVGMVWNVLLIPGVVGVAVLVALARRWFRPVPRTPAPQLSDPAALSRRKFVYLLAFGAAPAAAIGMGVHGTLTRRDLRVRTFEVALPQLPPELEGFTIAHVSDLHSGLFCGPTRLKLIREATQDLKADLIVNTGDLINHSMTEFPDVLASIRGLQAPHGLYLCEGNHDVIPGAEVFDDACARSGLSLLRNQAVIIPVENRRLILAGVPWMGRHYAPPPEFIGALYPPRQEGDVRVLLAHHPHLLDVAEDADLVLSGHTHGGQIMAGPIGLGPLFFKYWSGFYRRGRTSLIVSNGAGDWFPCRIGADAEIGLVRLTRA